jgi:hypothetical protein
MQDEDDDDEDEYGDVMSGHNTRPVADDADDDQMQQIKAKFKFKIGSSGLGRGAQMSSSTSYGNKFIDLRKTFQNFNANSNKVLQTPVTQQQS